MPDLPFTPWGEHEWQSYNAANGDYTGRLPAVRHDALYEHTPEPMQIMQSDTYLSFLFEQNSWFTVVPIDGRKHRDGIATWFGDSIGPLARRHTGHRYRELQREDAPRHGRPIRTSNQLHLTQTVSRAPISAISPTK